MELEGQWIAFLCHGAAAFGKVVQVTEDRFVVGNLLRIGVDPLARQVALGPFWKGLRKVSYHLSLPREEVVYTVIDDPVDISSLERNWEELLTQASGLVKATKVPEPGPQGSSGGSLIGFPGSGQSTN